MFAASTVIFITVMPLIFGLCYLAGRILKGPAPFAGMPSFVLYGALVIGVSCSFLIALSSAFVARARFGDANFLSRSMVRTFAAPIDRDLLLKTLESQGWVVTEESDRLIAAKHDKVIFSRVGGTHPVQVFHPRKLTIRQSESETIIEISPARRRELADFTMSNYYFSDALIEALGWKSKENTQRLK